MPSLVGRADTLSQAWVVQSEAEIKMREPEGVSYRAFPITRLTTEEANRCLGLLQKDFKGIQQDFGSLGTSLGDVALQICSSAIKIDCEIEVVAQNAFGTFLVAYDPNTSVRTFWHGRIGEKQLSTAPVSSYSVEYDNKNKEYIRRTQIQFSQLASPSVMPMVFDYSFSLFRRSIVMMTMNSHRAVEINCEIIRKRALEDILMERALPKELCSLITEYVLIHPRQEMSLEKARLQIRNSRIPRDTINLYMAFSSEGTVVTMSPVDNKTLLNVYYASPSDYKFWKLGQYILNTPNNFFLHSKDGSVHFMYQDSPKGIICTINHTPAKIIDSF